MKKLLFLAVIAIGISIASEAQTPQAKVKPTSSATQKVHNTFSKHKHYNGVKIKAKGDGAKHKAKVNAKTGEVKAKNTKLLVTYNT